MQKVYVRFTSGASITISRVIQIQYEKPGTCGTIIITATERNRNVYHYLRESAVDHIVVKADD